MSAYYNEIDPFAAAWLRELIKAKLIADGEVDTRSIELVSPDDVRGFTQCHFFAGIGGWSYALRLAGWPDDRPVWTGSCPCQPFSAAGKGLGFADERHLWPAWFWHIVQCRPDVVFGEQVDKALDWLDLVSTDLEGEDYSVGSIILPAAGDGAPHGRHRLWWVADSDFRIASDGELQRSGRLVQPAEDSAFGIGVADTGCASGSRGHLLGSERSNPTSGTGQLADLGIGSPTCSVGDSHDSGSQGRRLSAERLRELLARSPGLGGFWADADWIYCRDGKYRPVEPGTFPLAHGIPDRVGRLRGYGNAIVPQVAAAFIEAYVESVAA